MTILKLVFASLLLAAAYAFPCRTMSGDIIYPYAYFTSDPMRRGRRSAPPRRLAPVEPTVEPEALSTPEQITPPTMPPTAAPTTTKPKTTTSKPTTKPATKPSATSQMMPPNDSSKKEICIPCAKDNFRKVNEYRASRGLSQLTWNDKMAAEAAAHSKDMFERNYFEHSDLPYWENIAWALNRYMWNTVSGGFFEQWRKSSGHDKNMRTPTHKCGGVGIYGDGSKFYGTQVFSNRC